MRDALTLLRDMHIMQINTRACHSLIRALEPHASTPHADPFNAAPLITPPVVESAPVDPDDDEGADSWVEDEAFTAQFNETSARVHDPLHDVRPAPSVSPDDVVALPLDPEQWGDAYARVEHILTDYGYTPMLVR